jgi:threonyl-tRNA synthetase
MSQNIEHKRHSLAHLLANAVLELYPEVKNTIGPATEDGFYYDFDNLKISDKDLPRIEDKMRQLIGQWIKFSYEEVDAKKAKDIFHDNPYKLELINELEAKGEKITIYTCGGFMDLCKGGHTTNPAKDIDPKSWKLSRIAGAYWRGDEKNKMLTRIYGLAFNTEKELIEYETKIEEAKKRDHKKLGKELDLFTFSELVGSGLPLWTPKGTLVRDLLDGFVFELRQKAGYERVDIPHITKRDLYEKSGHWDKFKDELFKIKTREGHEFALKPMNCPHHTQIYARRLWSYRELPQRYANTTKVYRDEQTGELSGLTRVRSITQDDAHVFCRFNQVEEEVEKIWDIITVFYETFGFTLKHRLSFHNPNNMQAYLGSADIWLKTEDILRKITKKKNVQAIEAPGEAAFYGPKIDFLAKDSLQREWQVATIQLDMNMPDRFDLYCINETGNKERIVMIHAAIMGAIERFLAILIEHTAGHLPIWLSPIQLKILPVSEKYNKKAIELATQAKEKNIRVEVDQSNESLGKKVREAKKEKVGSWIVLGEKEIQSEKFVLEESEKEKSAEKSFYEIIEYLVKKSEDKS